MARAVFALFAIACSEREAADPAPSRAEASDQPAATSTAVASASSVAPAPSASAPAKAPMPAARPVAMVKHPGNPFRIGWGMGDPDERPISDAPLGNFELDATEVTVAAYQACVDSGRCTPAGSEPGCNGGSVERAHHPINCVDDGQAAAYCESVGKRLPTEAEWEFAARGFDRNRMYPWGLEPVDAQACWRRGDAGTCEVGSYPAGASRFGVLDLAGSVWEWTSSWYCPYEPEEAKRCREDIRDKKRTGARVVRGGGHADAAAMALRVTNRGLREPRHDPMADAVAPTNLGFRCAK
jgi:formylglycine-generating enzyme required for sulfatase activity